MDRTLATRHSRGRSHLLLTLALIVLSTSAFGGCTRVDPGPAALLPDPFESDWNLVPWVEGLDRPVRLVPDPTHIDRVLVAQMDGQIVLLQDGTRMPHVLIDLGDRLAADHREQGLLSFTLHPDFPTDARLFVTYTAVNHDVVLASFPAPHGTDQTIDNTTGQILLRVPQVKPYHNAGHLAFGPDGMLYVSFGDGSPQGDPKANAQNRDNLLGTIVRLDVDTDPGRITIPADNPFRDGDGRAEIWLYGLRNPWRFAFDDATGDLWIADVGFLEQEELNRVPAEIGGGHNLGWPVWEGHHRRDRAALEEPVLFPVYVDAWSKPCRAITAGYMHPDPLGPTPGGFLFGDFCTGAVHVLHEGDDGWHPTALIETRRPLVAIEAGPDGAPLLLTYDGTVQRLEYGGPSLDLDV